jgi:rubrerythrin
MKICQICSREEIYPGYFEENNGSCPVCGAEAMWIIELEDEDDESEEFG